MAMEANLQVAGVPIGMGGHYAVLPAQYFGGRGKQAPEHRLMIAVLHDALDCLEKHRFATNDRGRRLFRETAQWFLAHEADWPYSFESICGVLDLDSDAVRQRLCFLP